MKIFLDIIPPTVTAQEKRVRIVNGKPIFYESRRIKEARSLLTNALKAYRPNEPWEGPIELTVCWFFPQGKHRDKEYRLSRPDTDNLEKLLKDCMTAAGYWRDDALVVKEHVIKFWSSHPGVSIEMTALPKKEV